MFTGIVDRKAKIEEIGDRAGGRLLAVRVPEAPGLPAWSAVAVGESVAIDGVCLTAVECVAHGKEQLLTFEAVPETLRLTTLGALRAGDAVNVERSLAAGDRLGGHYVTGHIDGKGRVRERVPEGDQVLFELELEPPLLRQVIRKGSIAVDGISLTVIDVLPDRSTFTFAAIPHTLERTTLDARRPGSEVNIETDAFGKWVLHGFAQIGASELDLARLELRARNEEAP